MDRSEKVRDRVSPSWGIQRWLARFLLALVALVTAGLWWVASAYIDSLPRPFEAA